MAGCGYCGEQGLGELPVCPSHLDLIVLDDWERTRPHRWLLTNYSVDQIIDFAAGLVQIKLAIRPPEQGESE